MGGITGYQFDLGGALLTARGSGALWWPDEDLLVVSDLHLGKSGRMARLGGAVLPPYESRETLERLEAEIGACRARTVVCLGDSFDDAAAAAEMSDEITDWLLRLQAGRDWIWIEGNHDPGPMSVGGTHLAEMEVGPLILRHIAETDAINEVSGHYHPKARVASVSRRCFLLNENRVILPSYGTYTGGLRSGDPAFARLMGPTALAILTGPVALAVPMPR